MSLFPKKRHGPELKCSGPGFCQDCTEAAAERTGSLNGPFGPMGLPGPRGVSLNDEDVVKTLTDFGIKITKVYEHTYQLPCCYNCGHTEFLYQHLLDFFSCTQCFIQGNGSDLIAQKNLIKSAEFWDFVTKGPLK